MAKKQKYEDLESYVDEFLIPTYAKMKHIYHEKEDYQENYLSIPLNVMKDLKFSDEEFIEVMEYLKQRNIWVSGIDSTILGEFSNYEYIDRRGMELPFKKHLPNDQLDDLFREYRRTQSKEIRNELIEVNLRLVNDLSRRISDCTGVSTEEILGLGCEGLIQAIEAYDPDVSSKNTFSGYAQLPIFSTIYRKLAQQEGFSSGKRYWAYIQAKQKLLKENIPIEEIEDFEIEILKEIQAEEKFSPSVFTNRLMPEVFEKEYLEYETLEEELVDNTTLEKEVFTHILQQEIESMLQSLSDKKKEAVEGYYKEGSFAPVARKMGIKGEWVRQLVAKSRVDCKHLHSFLEIYDKAPENQVEDVNKVLIK